MKKGGYYILISPVKGEKTKEIFLSSFKIKLIKVFFFLFLVILPFVIYSFYYFYRNFFHYLYLKKRMGEYEARVKKLDVLERRLERVIKYARQVNYMLGVDSIKGNGAEQKEDKTGKKIVFSKEDFILPVEGIISRTFSKEHPAIDIVAPPGTPVVACMDGWVVDAGFSSYLGFYVKIKHKSGLKSVYGHLRRVFVKGGESIKKGQIIGEVGSTGKSTGPHLHFEMWKNGKPFNPLFFSLVKIF